MCFSAHPSSVLQPDPPPWCLPSHFPFKVIVRISSKGFLRRTPRVYPVSQSCCVRPFQDQLFLLSRVVDRLSHRISCNEATSAFTARYSLVYCAYSFLNMLSEGSIALLSRHDASLATGLESFTPIGLSPTRYSALRLDTPTSQRKA
jgi:hypothetical protein